MSESELDHASMDLEQDDARAGAASVADNACCEAEENFAASGVVQGMDIEREEGEKKSAQIEEDGRKAEVSSSGALVVGAAAVAEEGEESPDRPASRPRRSDAARPGLRTKTRSSSLASGKASESRGTRKRGEDGEELRSSSEELNNNGNNRGGGGDDEVDGTAYRCVICNEDFESAKSLSLHKKYHPQYTLRRNPKRSRKLIDQEFAVDAAAAAGAGGGAAAITATATSGGAPAPLQAAPTTKKTSSMSEEFPRPCTECGKEFASWKALFGHMRCHPEREWRGIQPPAEKHTDSAQGSGGAAGAAASFRRKKPQLPPPPAPSVITFQEENEKSASLDSKRAAPAHAGKASDNESDTDSFEAVYMTNGDRHTVTGWMTGKRSKRSRQTHRSLDAVNNAKKELSASNNVMTESNDMIEALMLLHSADKEKLTIPVTPDSHKTTASRSKSRTPESGLEAEAEELSAKRVKMEPDVASPCNDTEDGADDFDAGEQGSSARSKYECTTCKRQFKSHQALGGHRASHKKVKGCFARTNVSDGAAHEQSVDSMTEEPAEDDVKSEDNNNDDDDDHSLPLHEAETTTSPHHHHHHHHHSHSEEESAKPCYLAAARDDNEEMMQSLARKAKAHECSICHRVFTSGQALGGHKRCHWGGGSGIPEAAAATTTTTTTTTKPTTGRMLKEGVTLDLNLPAPECLEEMEEAGMSYSFFEIMHKEQHQSPPPTSGSAAADDQVVVEEQFASSFKPLVTTMTLVPGLTPTSA